jgi:hypothetical protein
VQEVALNQLTRRVATVEANDRVINVLYARYVSTAHDHEELHHLVGRLPPAQARRLLILVESDPDLAPYVEHEGEGEPARTRPLSVTGSWESGRTDGSERHDDYIRDRMTRPA